MGREVDRLAEIAAATAKSKQMLDRGNELANRWSQQAAGENVVAIIIATWVLQANVATKSAQRMGSTPGDVMQSVIDALTLVAQGESE